MKAFISSIIVIALLAAAVTINGIYISLNMKKLNEIIEEFPDSIDGFDDFHTTSDKFSSEWKKCRSIVSLSISHAEAEAIDEAHHQLCSRYLSKDEAGYAAAKIALKDEIDELKRTESFSLDGLL